MSSSGSGQTSSPTVYTFAAPLNLATKRCASQLSSLWVAPPSPDSLDRAIDAPPSSQGIRAYTEQMKRSSIFKSHSRASTFSSASSYSNSRGSSFGPEGLSLSRQLSSRSTASSRDRRDRPESVITTLFSRNVRKAKRDPRPSAFRGASFRKLNRSVTEQTSAKDHYYGKKSNSRRQQPWVGDISEPFNFQHVTHTRQDHLPDMHRKTRTELVSEFSAIRASQAPTHKLKGIRVQKMHFNNFSSEALTVVPSEEAPASSPRPELRRRGPSHALPRPLGASQSHDNMQKDSAPNAPCPASPRCPVPLPTRTSSRTAPPAAMNILTVAQRRAVGGFRHPEPLVIPLPPCPAAEAQEGSAHAVATSGDEAWPLTTSRSGSLSIGGELADVKEEEEELALRSRVSITSAELKTSRSVPALRHDRTSTMSTTLGLPLPTNLPSTPVQAQPSPGLGFNDSWESDIEWCYENEVEADCDYQWDPESSEAQKPPPAAFGAAEPPLQLKLQDEERVYHGRFRPSLSIPSMVDAPGLSPGSSSSTPTFDPRTPLGYMGAGLSQSPSCISPFRESHCFTLSPSLLIADFQLPADQDSCYSDQYGDSSNGAIFLPDAYAHAISPVDEQSSTASHRSSDFSRVSARSSASTRVSALSRGSQDSLMLGLPPSLSRFHCSLESSSSLPDLVPSAPCHKEQDASTPQVQDEIRESTPRPDIAGPVPSLLQHRLNKPLPVEPSSHGEKQSALSSPMAHKNEPVNILSSVAEASPSVPAQDRPMIHGRKASAPELIAPPREFKGRARSSTATSAMVGGNRRAGFMPFNQI